MTEQERPRTEAWQTLRIGIADRLMLGGATGLEANSLLDAIEEQARTEGRQQAVREAKELLDRNASESPPTCRHDAKWIADFTDWVIRVHEQQRDASESGPPPVALDPISGLPEHVVGPIAGEMAGQPPEASDE